MFRDKELYDKNDGERLFSPRVSKAGKRNLDKPIEEHLIAYKKYYNDNKVNKLRENIEKQENESKLSLCTKSSEILAGSFVNNLSRMYQALGGDQSR